MTKGKIWFLAVSLFAASANSATLEELFAAPPDEYALQAWYHWTASFVTEKGLTADLEAMKELGIGAAHIFGPAHGTLPGNREIVGTDAWCDRIEYAAKEANRLGIALGAHNCAGWSSSGGPWIRPEDSMKVVVSSCADVTGGQRVVTLPQPTTLENFYRDLAVYAFPWTPLPKIVAATGSLDDFTSRTVEFAASCGPKSLVFDFRGIHLWGKIKVEASPDGNVWETMLDEKVRYYRRPEGVPCIHDLKAPKEPCRFYRVSYEPSSRPDPYPPHLAFLRFEGERLVPAVHEMNGAGTHGPGIRGRGPAATRGIEVSSVVDVSDRLKGDGTLDWPVPAGTWRIVRLGYTTTGAMCRPAAKGAQGLECDKLSRRGLDAHWPHLPARYLSTAAGHGAFRTMTIDSYEQPGQNWTEGFDSEFARRRSYPLGVRLLSVVGYPIGTLGETVKFLNDYTQTVADLFVENYFGYFTELCHRNGLKSIAETYGGPFPVIDASTVVDIPAGEIWDRHNGDGMSQFCRTAASAAHVAGATGIAAAEAFTGFAPFARFETTPADMRIRTDDIWSRGVNQIVYHSYVHQPWMNVKPGMTLGAHGVQLNRHTTWWKEAKLWADYVRRGQVLLRAGRPCADVLCFGGMRIGERPKDFACDLVETRAFLRLENLPDGCVGVPGEGRCVYPVLFVACGRYMTIPVMLKLQVLLDGGARIAVAGRPVESPSLGEPTDEWKQVAEKLFADKRFRKVASPREALSAFGRKPDVLGAEELSVVHRRLGDRDIYFFANTSTNASVRAEVSVVSRAGLRPEIWDVATGTRGLARLSGVSSAGRTGLILDLPPTRSRFVVFSPVSDVLPPAKPFLDVANRPVVQDVSLDWKVTFPEAGTVDFPKLVSWSESPVEAIRHYSGRAVYRRTFRFDRATAQARTLLLDLGDVRDAATVRVNGRTVATLIESPYAVDLAGFVAGGENVLEIEVVNSWPNRLIGDANIRRSGKVAEPKTVNGRWPDWVLADRPVVGIHTWSTYTNACPADEPLSPAGLLGPVRLLDICEQ